MSIINKVFCNSDDSCLVLEMLLNLFNGKVHVQRYHGRRVPTGSELKYTCNDGYQLEGVDTNTCLGNNTWSHTTLPHCFDSSWIGTIIFQYFEEFYKISPKYKYIYFCFK